MINNLDGLFDQISNVGEMLLPLRLLKNGPLEKWVLLSLIRKRAGLSERIPIPSVLFELLEIFQLIYLRKKRHKMEIVSLTESGNALVRCKQGKEFDRLTPEQGKIFLPIFLKQTRLNNDLLHLLHTFIETDDQSLVIYTNDARIKNREEKLLKLLQQLKLATYENGRITIKKREKEWLLETLERSSFVNEEMLLKMLERRQTNGAEAEEAALEFEGERLTKLGRQDLVSEIRYVAKENIAAGYDIASFDGFRQRVGYDRFIEVKGTVSNSVVFYLTKTEIETARNLDKKYWLYCVSNLDEKPLRKVNIFQNPYNKIFRENKFRVEPVLWKISAVDKRDE